jgi:hypothetical protein
MFTFDELEWIGEEAVVSYYKVLSRYSSWVRIIDIPGEWAQVPHEYK